MPRNVIEVHNLSKFYRLGEYGTGTFYEDLNILWQKLFRQSHSNDHFSELFCALDDINLTIERGEVIGVIGKNGAGKSTLLKILSRITSPTSGVVKVKGRMASLLEVGTGFHPELTGRENIFLNGSIMGMTKLEISQRLDQIIEFSGCGQHIDTPVKRYSSGMRVRLGFAVAAHLDADILIVDEVLAVGDFEFQRKCLNKMKDVSSSGRTVIFVSHNMDSILRLCQRCVCLEEGKIKYQGETSEVIQQYLGSFNSSDDDGEIDYPESSLIRIHKVHLDIDSENSRVNNNSFGYAQSISVKVDYEIYDEAFSGGFALLVRDINEEVIFSSWDSDGGDQLDNFLASKSVIVDLPKELIRPGMYEIAIVVHERAAGFTQKHIEYKRKIVVKDDGSINGLKRPGAVIPKLTWQYSN